MVLYSVIWPQKRKKESANGILRCLVYIENHSTLL